MSSLEFTFTFRVTIIISVFVPGRSRVVQKLKKWVCLSSVKKSIISQYQRQTYRFNTDVMVDYEVIWTVVKQILVQNSTGVLT